MSIDVLQTCPHCRAIVQTTVCSICGKSTFEEVATPPPPPRRELKDAFENDELRKVVVAFLAMVTIGAGVAFLLTRPASAPSATSLPPPASTTTVAEVPDGPDAPPSLLGGARPTSGFLPGTPLEVGEGLSPWETPPPVDFVTGLLLDESLDYAADIARVDALLAAAPDVLELVALDPPEVLTLDGPLDVELLETTQPFAARRLQNQAGVTVGELWLIASAGTSAGDAYLAAARERWNLDAAVDQYAPEVGVRLWLLGTDGSLNLWASDLDDDSLVLVQASVQVQPGVLTDALQAWRRLAA